MFEIFSWKVNFSDLHVFISQTQKYHMFISIPVDAINNSLPEDKV